MRWARIPARDLGVAASLFLVVAVFFAAPMFRGRVLFERDINQVYWGQAETFVRCIFEGSWPVWDPLGGFGQPMLANPSTQVFYPWTWLNLVMPPTQFYTFYVCSHLFLSGLGLYCYGRRRRLSRASGLAAAVLWMASGPLLSLVSLWHHFAGAAWIPWVLLAVDRTLERPRFSRAAGLGLVLAIQVAAGSADMMVLTAALALAGAVGRERSPAPMALRRQLAALGLACAVALGLTAALLLPALAVARVSDRASLPTQARDFWSVPPVGLVQAVLPVFPQRLPLSPAVRSVLYDSREPFLNSIYLGLAALPLVLSAFLGRWRREASALAAIGVVATLAALGRFGFVYGLLTSLVPPLQSLRYPVKAMIVPALAWSMLAGFGLETWREAAPARFRQASLALCALAVLLVESLAAFVLLRPAQIKAAYLASASDAAAHLIQPIGWALAATGLTCALVSAIGARSRVGGLGLGPCLGVLALLASDVFMAHHDLNPSVSLERFARPPVVDRLRADHATRIYAFDYLAKVLGKAYRRPNPEIPWAHAEPTVPASLASALAWQDFLGAPVAERWGLAGSFDADLLGLRPRPLRNLGLYFRASEEAPAFARLLRIGAVSHVVALHTEGLEELQPLGTDLSPFAGPVHSFAVPGTLPPVYAASGARIANGLRALQVLTDPGFDPAREVVLVEGSPVPSDSTFAARLAVVGRVSDRVLVDSELSEAGYVVLVQSHDSGWRVRIDGREAPLLRANVAFCGVRAPAGRHRIEFVYRPPALLAGLAISGCTLVLLVVAAAIRRGRRRFRA